MSSAWSRSLQSELVGGLRRKALQHSGRNASCFLVSSPRCHFLGAPSTEAEDRKSWDLSIGQRHS